MNAPAPKMLNSLSVNIGLMTMLSFFQTSFDQQSIRAENIFQCLQTERDKRIFLISATLMKSLKEKIAVPNDIEMQEAMHANKCDAIQKIISIFNE
jgi:hypothetical protein